ncbi:MAG: SufD family Fe-S cluster assembly protein [Candidatus Nanopelagicales bacterium]|nr:SufD family Fe-S cluster assembly protein [Candidatus Nanopelagicales bacterium]
MRQAVVVPASDLGPRVRSRNPQDFDIPLGREEEWRFTPIKKLQDFFEVQSWGSQEAEISDYVSVVQLSDPRLSANWLPTNRPSAVAYAAVQQAILVDIPQETTVAEPIVVNVTSSMLNNYAHIEVRAGSFSQSQVVIIHDSQVNVSGSIVVTVNDSAELTLMSVIDAQAPVRQHWNWSTEVHRDSRFTGLSISLGGEVVRIVPTITYKAPGGSAEMLGAFLLQDHQFQEHRIMVDHTEPHCISNVIYKGALSGQEAHSVWVGDVIVRREATGIETYELNRNLLLDDGPRADSVPNLELETGDVVSAGHASATGRFDDEQLFYLQARGIPEMVARQLVVRGFFVDVLNKLNDPVLSEDLMRRIENRLGMDTHESAG